MASKREKIKLKNPESKCMYVSEKNKSNTSDRVTLKKYAPDLQRHVEFKETK